MAVALHAPQHCNKEPAQNCNGIIAQSTLPRSIIVMNGVQEALEGKKHCFPCRDVKEEIEEAIFMPLRHPQL